MSHALTWTGVLLLIWLGLARLLLEPGVSDSESLARDWPLYLLGAVLFVAGFVVDARRSAS